MSHVIGIMNRYSKQDNGAGRIRIEVDTILSPCF